jgi:ketosteroid isomerase-like protein
MNNIELVTRFYSAFQKLDYATMQDCYSDEVIFQDPAFGVLNGIDAKSMWEMLAKNAENFSLVFSDIKAEDEEYITCKWVATYTFSATNRKVVNRIQAYIRIQNGKITEHTDHFNFWKWARQATGLSGWLLGWSSFFQSQVRSKALENLRRFMEKKGILATSSSQQ